MHPNCARDLFFAKGYSRVIVNKISIDDRTRQKLNNGLDFKHITIKIDGGILNFCLVFLYFTDTFL